MWCALAENQRVLSSEADLHLCVSDSLFELVVCPSADSVDKCERSWTRWRAQAVLWQAHRSVNIHRRRTCQWLCQVPCHRNCYNIQWHAYDTDWQVAQHSFTARVASSLLQINHLRDTVMSYKLYVPVMPVDAFPF